MKKLLTLYRGDRLSRVDLLRLLPVVNSVYLIHFRVPDTLSLHTPTIRGRFTKQCS